MADMWEESCLEGLAGHEGDLKVPVLYKNPILAMLQKTINLLASHSYFMEFFLLSINIMTKLKGSKTEQNLKP